MKASPGRAGSCWSPGRRRLPPSRRLPRQLPACLLPRAACWWALHVHSPAPAGSPAEGESRSAQQQLQLSRAKCPARHWLAHWTASSRVDYSWCMGTGEAACCARTHPDLWAAAGRLATRAPPGEALVGQGQPLLVLVLVAHVVPVLVVCRRDHALHGAMCRHWAASRALRHGCCCCSTAET